VRVVSFDGEELLSELLRKQLKESRERYKGKEAEEHRDSYHSNIRRRLYRLYHDVGHLHLAQRVKDVRLKQIEKLELISLDALGVPQLLSWKFHADWAKIQGP
jgi:hypothetical protein